MQQFQQHSINLLIAISAVSTGISSLLINCYFGKMATESYVRMVDCVCNKIKWYELPIRLQKYFILMIENMQKPLYYHGFGVIYLKLETFTNVSVNSFQ